MPSDITFCCGQGCPLKENCLRCTGVAYGRYSSFGKMPCNIETGQCDYYLDDRPSEEKVRQLAYQLWEKAGCESGKAVQYWLQAREQLIQQIRNS